MITDEMLYEAAKEVNQALVRQWEELPWEEHVFSKSFERKMRRLIHRTKYQLLYRILKQAACLVLVLLLGCASVLTVHADSREAVIDWIQRMMYYRDAGYLVEQVEDIHPCFVLDDIPAGYEEAKEQYLKTVKSKNMDEKAFELESMRYLASLDDMNSGIRRKYAFQQILDLEVARIDGEICLINEEQLVEGKITSIGGAAIDQIWAVVEQIFPVSNQSSAVFFAPYLRFDDILRLAGVETENNVITVSWENESEQQSADFSLLPYEDYKKLHAAPRSDMISYKRMDAVFYLKTDYLDLNRDLDDVCTALSAAIAQGCTDVIIDVCGDSGGDSNAYLELLKTMDMQAASYTVYSRLLGSGKCRMEEDNRIVQTNSALRLMVLSDEHTSGSAANFCVLVKDSGLGQLVGRPSSLSPSSYGYGPSFTLPNTGLEGVISSKYWQRPDADADPDSLEMDVTVPYGEDILFYALELLQNRN